MGTTLPLSRLERRAARSGSILQSARDAWSEHARGAPLVRIEVRLGLVALASCAAGVRDGVADSSRAAPAQKRLRAEPLTTAEEALLARLSRKPDGPTVPHSTVMGELADRQRRGE